MLRRFFDRLGPERSAAITHGSADQADWIAEIVAERCPQAVRWADPFHIIKWANEALDEVRRQAWNDARRSGQTYGKGRGRRDAAGDARRLKNFAVCTPISTTLHTLCSAVSYRAASPQPRVMLSA